MPELDSDCSFVLLYFLSDPLGSGVYGIAHDADDHPAGVKGPSPVTPTGLALLLLQTIRSARSHQNKSVCLFLTSS